MTAVRVHIRKVITPIGVVVFWCGKSVDVGALEDLASVRPYERIEPCTDVTCEDCRRNFYENLA